MSNIKVNDLSIHIQDLESSQLVELKDEQLEGINGGILDQVANVVVGLVSMGYEAIENAAKNSPQGQAIHWPPDVGSDEGSGGGGATTCPPHH